MIKLKNILNESRSEYIDETKAFTFLKSLDIPIDEIINNKAIYRGNNLYSTFYYINPKNYDRKSIDTSNFYTMAIDNFPEWKDYPKRGNSIICTQSSNIADYYGNVYRVIPLSKYAKIAVCSTKDIWFSFKIDLKILNELISNTLSYLSFELTQIYTTDPHAEDKIKFIKRVLNDEFSYNDLLDIFKLLDEHQDILFQCCDNKILSFPYWKTFKKGTNFKKWYENFLNPIKNKFTLTEFGLYNSKKFSYKEIWTDCECLLIEESSINEVIDEYKKFLSA